MIIDIKDMPGYNPIVANGIDSVSKGKVFTKYSIWKTLYLSINLGIIKFDIYNYYIRNRILCSQ